MRGTCGALNLLVTSLFGRQGVALVAVGLTAYWFNLLLAAQYLRLIATCQVPSSSPQVTTRAGSRPSIKAFNRNARHRGTKCKGD